MTLSEASTVSLPALMRRSEGVNYSTGGNSWKMLFVSALNFSTTNKTWTEVEKKKWKKKKRSFVLMGSPIKLPPPFLQLLKVVCVCGSGERPIFNSSGVSKLPHLTIVRSQSNAYCYEV